MLFMLLLFCGINFVFAASLPQNKDAVVLIGRFDIHEKGNYNFSYITSNGIERNESGSLVNEGEDNKHIVVKGYYAYTDPEGIYRILKYTADENGYRVDVAPSSPSVKQIEGGSPLINRMQSTTALIASIIGK